MKTYFRLLGFAKPIEKYAIPYFFYTLFYSFLSVLTIAMVGPVVNMLFSGGEVPLVTEMPRFALSSEYLTNIISYCIFLVFGENFVLTNVLVLVAMMIVVMALFSNLFRYLGQRIMENMRINAMMKLRNAVYDNVISLHVGFFNNERKGDIMAKITSDVQMVQFCISSILQVMFREPFLIIFYLLSMVAISWELTLFAVIYLPIVAFLIGAIVKRLRRSASEAQDAFGQMTSVLDESLSGIKTVKGYNAEGFFRGKFHWVNDLYSSITKKMVRRQQLASPTSEFLGIAAAAGLLIFGGSLVQGGSLDSGFFIAYIGLFTQITRPVRALTDAFANINQGIASGERVFSLLDTKSPIVNAENAVELNGFHDSLEFRDVHFSYDTGREVICGVSFKVQKGQTVALVGASGGGKSTISDLIPRFYDVTGGEILIDGRNIKEYDIHSLRSVLGIVAQETVLFNDTIENNIRLGNETATLEDVQNAARIANAEKFILESPEGYQTNIGDRGAKLSGGQRQRLSIARAVLKNPDVLILDEATSALDTESEKLVQDALNTLLCGRTSIVIAHRLSTIHNADRIIVIDKGRIVEEGTHADLMERHGVYAKLIEMQQFS